jgi:hypothetical protein
MSVEFDLETVDGSDESTPAIDLLRCARGLAREVRRLRERVCTCGSGAHPRHCKVHPEEFQRHCDELGAEARLDALVEAAKAALDLIARLSSVGNAIEFDGLSEADALDTVASLMTVGARVQDDLSQAIIEACQ